MNNLQEQENYNQEDQFSQDNVSRENNWEAPLDNSFINEEPNRNLNRNVFDQDRSLDKESEVDEVDSDDEYLEDEDDLDEDEDNVEDEDDDLEDEEDDLEDEEDDDFEEEDLNDEDGDRNDVNPVNPSRM